MRKTKSLAILGISFLLSLVLTDISGVFEPVLLPNKNDTEKEEYE